MSGRGLPSRYEQAREAARDDLELSAVCNIVYDLPAVTEVLVDGESDDWRPTAVTVGFRDTGGNHTRDVLTIMRRQGFTVDSVTFCYESVRFVRGETDE